MQVGKSRAMDDKTIQGIAHTHATGLCIVDNALAHLKVAKLVEVVMHDSRTQLDNIWIIKNN